MNTGERPRPSNREPSLSSGHDHIQHLHHVGRNGSVGCSDHMVSRVRWEPTCALVFDTCTRCRYVSWSSRVRGSAPAGGISALCGPAKRGGVYYICNLTYYNHIQISMSNTCLPRILHAGRGVTSNMWANRPGVQGLQSDHFVFPCWYAERG